MIEFCKKCLLPSTKPHITFKNGVCSACIFHEEKKNFQKGINWKERKKEFDKIIEKLKKKKNPHYDAMVPVSGGKDSISQVHRMLGKKLRIVAVHVDYGIKTYIGKQNLDVIPKMGVDLISFKPEQKIHKYLIKRCFLDYGDPDLMSHSMLHAFPLRFAHNFKIPFVLLGEDSSKEYSGEKTINKGMTKEWFDKYACSGNIFVNDISKRYKIKLNRLTNYQILDSKNLKKLNTVFCSHFFKWESSKNLTIAKKYGFKTLKHNGEGTYRNYVGIDEKINRVHQFFKLIKFGYGRATDHVCEDIRNNRISRNKGISLVLKYDREYISEDIINEFINHINISRAQFDNAIKKFLNKKLWLIKGKSLFPKFEIR